MTMHNHYQLLPMYSATYPMKMLFMIARQLGKSTNLAASNIIRSSCLPFYHSLLIQPRFDQIVRFNSTIYQPMAESCIMQKEFISDAELRRQGLKKYRNGSITILSHMFLSPSKLRGISGASFVCADEVQDINRDFLPIVQETMSASEHWATLMETGTPTTTDTTLGLEWEESSQAEWIIKCQHCGYYNIPNPVHDVQKMIGKNGAICAKCGKDVNPVFGKYVPAHPDRHLTFAGYHISQTIHPMHCMNPRKWPDILTKIEQYPEMQLYNEVFGWPYDRSVVPLTRKDVLDSRNGHKYKTSDDIPGDLSRRYRYLVVGIDWDGGGSLSVSFTNVTVCGLRKASNVIDCIYGERIKKGQKAKDVARHIMGIIEKVNPDLVAYDAGGAGFLYRQIMIEEGFNEQVSIPFKYCSPSSGAVIRYHKGIRDDNAYYYSIDKSRSLSILIEAVKARAVTNPWFDEKNDNAEPLELLSLIEMPKVTQTGDTVYLIGKKPGVPDDYAHALNFACAAIWDHFHNYPKLGDRYDTASLVEEEAVSAEESTWTDPDEWQQYVDEINGPVMTPGGF